jgi:hypothetical protein
MVFRRMSLAAAVVLLALPATAGAAHAPPDIPDLAAMTTGRGDLPRGSSVVGEGFLPVPTGEADYYRSFHIPPRSGLARLDSLVVLFAGKGDATQLMQGARLVFRDPQQRRTLGRIVARSLGVRARKVRVGPLRRLRIADDGFAVTIKAGRATIAVGMFRLDRVVAEIDALGARRGKRTMRRMRAVANATSERIRRGLSPVSVGPPTVSGTAQVGALLQAGPGVWSEATKPSSFAYEWQRCDASGACVPIPGAGQASYSVAAADRSSTLRVLVTATNAVGSTTAVSGPTPAVP